MPQSAGAGHPDMCGLICCLRVIGLQQELIQHQLLGAGGISVLFHCEPSLSLYCLPFISPPALTLCIGH